MWGRRLHGVGYCWNPCGGRGELNLVNVDSDEIQGWYISLTRTQLAKFSDAKHKIKKFLSNTSWSQKRTNSQRQSYYYATERWRDIKISLMNKLAKVKSYLQTQLSEELCKPMTDHKSYIEVRNAIELLVSMFKMLDDLLLAVQARGPHYSSHVH